MPILKYRNLLLLISHLLISVIIAFWGYRYESYTVVLLVILSLIPFFVAQDFENETVISSFSHVFWTGLIARLIFFFSLPKLSDDYFRFIWDGYLWNTGISAYQYMPSQIISSFPYLSDLLVPLYTQLNSKEYYSVYPPLYQLFFQCSSFFFGTSIEGNLLFFRSVLLLIELIALSLLLKLNTTRKRNMQSKITLYWLNGLVIVESIGNIHIESLIGLLLLLCIYYFRSTRAGYYLGLFFSIGFLIKLQPIVYALIFFLRKKMIHWLYAGICCLIIGLLFFFFFDFATLYKAIEKSTTLFIRNFEFNASIYFILSKIGELWIGHNPIQFVGPALSILNACLIFLYSIYHWQRKKQMSDGIIIILSIYLFFSTTVHPWYIIPMLMVAPLSRLKYPFIWGICVFLSYWGYAKDAPYQHPFFLIFIQYLIIVGAILYDFKKEKIPI